MNEHDEKPQGFKQSIDYVSSHLTLAAILKPIIYGCETYAKYAESSSGD
jgi:hypothetical protein